ncbi:MAG: EAL domain-containing protein [Methylophilus sp.]|nr:EAL domain-containing protein [Methylophilus sp.]
MQISGTFLKSKIAKKIALLVFLSTLIPLALITVLSLKNIHQLSNYYEHQSLVRQSNTYALSVFGNLIIAKNSLIQLSDHPSNELQGALRNLVDQYSIFNSVIQVSANNDVVYQYGTHNHYSRLPQEIKHLLHPTRGKVDIVLLPEKQLGMHSRVFLVTTILFQKQESTLLAELNPTFLWGKKEDYPSDVNVCAYSLEDSSKTNIFCSAEPNQTKSESDDKSSGSWELFLRGEFDSNDWLFDTTRLHSIKDTGLASFMKGYDYIGVASLSLLIAGLISLRRIRKTMVPLEQLINGASKVANGDYSLVKVDDSSEFSELADAFNHMSSSIQQKISTLESLSLIDREIVSKLDVEKLIDQIITRMQQLKPDAAFYLFRIDEKTSEEAHCNVSIFKSRTLVSKRITIPIIEIEIIKSYLHGKVIHKSSLQQTVYEKVVKEYGDEYFWVLPIFWQNKLNALLIVGCPQKLKENDGVWQEYRELSRRFGIAISAQAREDMLIRQSQHDMLTGLPNRILLEDRITQAIEQSNNTGNPVWVIFLDLDRFKYINDSMGHNIGDNVLSLIAKRLKACLREIDTVARFGGDEFVIVLHCDQGENISTEVLNRLIDTVAQPIQINQHEVITTCSLGISVYPHDGDNTEDLIKFSDIAMYRAKELGKNNFQFYTKSMNEKAEMHMRMYTLLNNALERNEFILVYQPKVDLTSKKIVGFEALIRWNSAELGMVSPLNFIPLAEETGLILPIGEWVLRTACEQAFKWEKAGFGDLLMSVNVSARQFVQTDFTDTISRILAETGLNARNLDIELTESLLFKGSNNTLEILNSIKQLGVHISIDDFGTGYSNLAYLNKLPINTIKIDKIFTDEITKDMQKAPIVDTIIKLAKNMNLKVVAEGVESNEQLAHLITGGCDEIQGYYFSRPERPEIIEGMLNARKTLP